MKKCSQELILPENIIHGPGEHGIFFYHEVLDGGQHLLCLVIRETRLCFQALNQFRYLALCIFSSTEHISKHSQMILMG